MKLRRPGFVVGVALAAAGAVGCSGPQVRSLGTGGGAPAYELRDARKEAVDAQAARLCARGYVVLREAQQFSPTLPEANAFTEWAQAAGFWLAGMPGNQAQATVQCLD